MMGLVGIKQGMTRIFTEDGLSVPVTVVEIKPNVVTQIKTAEKDLYNAVQVAFGECRADKLTKPLAGCFNAVNVAAKKFLHEFRFPDNKFIANVGDEIKVDIFSEGQKVDVIGISKGKGFAGTIKRWNFSGQPNSHGNSLSHRVPGSIGQNQSPGKVFKNKKMPGRLGNERCTIQNQMIYKLDLERNLVLLKGIVPGFIGGIVIVVPSCKVKAE